MAGREAGRDEKRSLRGEVSAGYYNILELASEVLGVGKSELVRASVDVGPALSAEGVERVEALTGRVLN